MDREKIEAFRNFDAGCYEAPEGAYEAEKEVRREIGAAVDRLIKIGKAHGMKPCNCDGAFELEAAIYAWLKKGSTFGAALEGIAASRIKRRSVFVAGRLGHEEA